jgi:hypothetical protein
VVTDRVLTVRDLNRATLARQMLLDREANGVEQAIERLAGLQAQVAGPPFIGLWTRLATFGRADLADLLERRRVVRSPLMRSTLHLMTAEEYLRLRPALQPALTRALGAFFGQRAKTLDVDRLVAAARPFMEEPRTYTALRALLAELEPGQDPEAMAYAVRTHLPLVQVFTGGAWGYSSNAPYVLAEAWLGRPLEPADPRLLVRRYLAAFGPATVRDMQTWSGMPTLRTAVDAIKPELRSFRDEQGNELFDLPDMPLPPAETPASPRFLPEYDNLLLAHADRTRVIADQYRPRVFLSAARVRSTFLVDGFVQGAWKIEQSKGTARLVIEPFMPLEMEVARTLAEDGERLVRFVSGGAGTIEVVFNIVAP